MKIARRRLLIGSAAFAGTATLPAGLRAEGFVFRARRSVIHLDRPPPGDAPVPFGPPPDAPTLDEALSGLGERTFDLESPHTGETLSLGYWRDGAYDAAALDELARFLRDWRSGEVHPTTERVADLLAAIGLTVGGRLSVVSGYRTPETNKLLRDQGKDVANNSFHLKARAVDIASPGGRTRDLAELAMGYAAGGVGIYEADGFVHIDDGPVRRWAA